MSGMGNDLEALGRHVNKQPIDLDVVNPMYSI